MKEKNYRRDVVRMLQPIGAFAVENEAHDGCPDICTCAGWIEMKLARLPARADTRVAVDLRNAQRIWLKRWRRHNGRAWTLTVLEIDADVRRIWMLHDGKWSAEHLGDVPYGVMQEASVATWDGGPTAQELIDTLTKKEGW